ncbi:hypothetical protein ACHAPJ_001253 [Fusarium lateritium]
MDRELILEHLFYTIWNLDFRKTEAELPAPPSTCVQSKSITTNTTLSAPAARFETTPLVTCIKQDENKPPAPYRSEARLALKKRKCDKYAATQSTLDEEATRGCTKQRRKDTKALMQDALPSIRNHKSSRYRNLPGDDTAVVKSLSNHVNPNVLEVLNKESFGRDDLVDISGNIDYKRSGIYFHMLFHPDQDDFYGYGGQADDLDYRINQQHCNPWHRARHPSLHYYVWDSRSD